MRDSERRRVNELSDYATYKIVAGNAIAATVKVKLMTIASPKLIKVLIPCDTSFSKKNYMVT